MTKMLALLIIKATITVKNKYKELNFKILRRKRKKNGTLH